MVKIRLTQTGMRNKKQYRIIVIDESKKRQGSAIENVGYYNPLTNPPEISIKKDRIDYWISKGAQITDGVKKIIK